MGIIPYTKIMTGTIKKVVGVVMAFFEKILNMLRKIIQNLENKLKYAIEGSTVLIEKGINKCQVKTKNYVRDEEKHCWKEVVVEYTQSEKEIPPEYRQRYENGEVIDITEDFILKLG
ncbi:hypothetical protein [Clostridium transplantifaecale]|uniref:hypothetical protein n=1 Tax=Clostridium transplantifaecale TaxID=2479838 RepID=UPI000F64132D|nr:hypothetical protein [Clostridium transplantifaecale]